MNKNANKRIIKIFNKKIKTINQNENYQIK